MPSDEAWPTKNMSERYCFEPLSARRWNDFERLFGPHGACGGCWCMYWKLPQSDFDASLYEENRRAQEAIVGSGITPGLLAYLGSEPVGWIAVEPRRAYPRLARSRVLTPVDDRPVWSITCFFVNRRHRRQGLGAALLRAAVSHVKHRGGKIVEGYPVDAPGERLPTGSAYTGVASMFRKAGFREVARNSKKRPIYRYRIGG